MAPNENAAYFVDHVRGKSSWTHPVTGESSYLVAERVEGEGAPDGASAATLVESAIDEDEILPPFAEVASRLSVGDWRDQDDDYDDNGDDDISRVVEDRTFAEVSLL